MDAISFWYRMGMCGVFLANFLNAVGHTRVGAIGIFGLIVIVILFFVVVGIGIVFLQLCQAINTANRLLIHQKLMMALQCTKRLFRTWLRNEPDRQIQLEA